MQAARDERRALHPRAALLTALLAAGCMPPSWGAAGLLHPARRAPKQQPARPFESVELQGEGVRLKGWRFRGEGPIRRGTVIYLHGIGDNRGSSLGIADRYVRAGFDVLAYDSRAHGESEGQACTYGVYEKQDLLRVLATVEARPIILIGVSLGAAVALQTAAQTKDVAVVISVATFSDLRSVANDRAPFFASKGNIEDAFRIAEREARFRVDEASPVAAAPHIAAPVLVIHGAIDDQTPPVHSQRVYAALHGPKRLILVPGAGHDNALNKTVWPQLDEWLRSELAAVSPQPSVLRR
jgi:pimeloyl-ACP methyl ester carboxylesterase